MSDHASYGLPAPLATLGSIPPLTEEGQKHRISPETFVASRPPAMQHQPGQPRALSCYIESTEDG